MEKITKSTDTVLIDPNEPLILPDGTALVGRIEWFLYALCCLDYQNLPTPMSRIEEFANALITGEIPNIQPQSRAEQFFLAILDGNVSNLPQPQSRSEVLLDKLARGEFDLSDVEPIQSRYELLLAYLIKNGGIGNIDYVLYEFSEAMKTMYNTVEKPFKSLELSGNTLVNCVLEDTENDDYTSFDKDYSGTSFTINGTSEGAIKSAILSGQTLKNINDYRISVNSNVTIGADGTITINANGKYTEVFLPALEKLPSTKYWVGINVIENTLNGDFNICAPTGSNCIFNYFFSIVQGFVGVKEQVLTTTTDLSSAIYAFRSYLSSTVTEGVIKYKVMAIPYQDGMENWDIPYFTGMKSVKMPVLTTTNGSANILIGSQLNDVTGEIETSPYGNKMIEDYILIPNADITMSSAQWLKVFFYDENKVYISNTGGGYIDSYVLNSSTIPTNAKYFRYHYSGSSYPVIKFSDGTDYITPTVGSEPYKTNILTTIGKNLFDMNRPYDAITDSQATVVQDTNQITVSSAESGMYVNANFILDKDFFAGKTVTGSCLYESDEKDIGTVQIYYQDGNGEHHYQWIRTPRTFTFPNSFIGDVMLCVSANNTGTPQSNTVTVKNIQLELGSTATTYEPYSEGVTLRGIGDVQDTLDLTTGELTQRIGEVVLDGSDDEEWNAWITEETMIVWTMPKSFVNLINPISDRYISSTAYGKTEEMFAINSDDTRHIQLRLFKTTARNINELKIYLQSNPIAVQYKLETPTIKTVDLNVVDQNNIKIDKIHVFDGTTHVNASSDVLTPTVNIGKSVSYPTIIKPNTKYTVDLKRNDKPLTVNLGGTEVTFVDGETRKVITTPSTLTNDKLSYYGVGAKCNEIMLIEGEIERNIDYFTGMQSVVMQNQMPILSTVGKNLFDMNRRYDSVTNAQATVVQNIDEITISSVENGTYVNVNFVLDKNLFKGKTVTGSCLYESDEKNIGTVQINYQDTTGKKYYQSIKTSKTFTFPNEFVGEVLLCVYANNTNTPQLNTVTVKNIQLELGTKSTAYEAHKSSILSCNNDVTLRGIGDVKDTLDLMTGEYVQHIGEVVFDGSEDWYNTSKETDNYIMFRSSEFSAKFIPPICDRFNTYSTHMPNINEENGELLNLQTDNNCFQFIIKKEKLSSNNVEGFKQWLSQNPTTVQYRLATSTIKTVDSNVVDQDGNIIPKIKSYDGVTHFEVTVPKQSLLPNVSAEVATDNSKDMSLLTTKHQEISEAQATIQDNIQSQSDEIDTALMATTEIFESILE